jgi:FKBP-type peptidyl-prolyl cis-trans isomerase
MYERIIESLYTGDIYAAIQTMHLGDSATFIMNGDTFFHYFMGQPFRFEKNALYFDLKLNKITSQEEYEQKQDAQRQQYEAMIEELRLSESDLINDYLADKNINVTPTASGLYFIKTATGKGKAIKNGSKVAIHYTGKFLDGSVFDSSVEQGDPIEFIVGESRFISGWDEAILLMRGGDRATVLLPSKLAYGARGMEYAIPPYTPLVFDLEAVSVE